MTIELHSLRSLVVSRSWRFLFLTILLAGLTIFGPAAPWRGRRPAHPPYVDAGAYHTGVIVTGVLCGIVFLLALWYYVRLLLDSYTKKEIHYEGAITDIRPLNETHYVVELNGGQEARVEAAAISRAALAKGQRAVLVVSRYSEHQLALVVVDEKK